MTGAQWMNEYVNSKTGFENARKNISMCKRKYRWGWGTIAGKVTALKLTKCLQNWIFKNFNNQNFFLNF